MAQEEIEPDAVAGIRRGLEQMERGEGRPAEEVFSEFQAKHDLMAAIREGEKAVQEGRMQPAEAVFTQLETKHGF